MTPRAGRVVTPVLVLLALALLVAMAVGGGVPGLRGYARFEASGLMREALERIDRVELAREGHRWVFARDAAGGWVAADGERAPIAPDLAAHLEAAIRFLRVSAPIRVMHPEEYRGALPEEFGLEPPRYTVAVFSRGAAAFSAAFGNLNPMQTAQYVRVEGRGELYLMPRHVGREWEAVVEGRLAANGAA